MSHKVALLIPSTTHERNWKNYSETDLYKINMKSLLLTYCQDHSYTYYIGIDDDDKIYSDPKQQEAFKRFINIMKNVDIQFISMKNIKKGHLTAMWNRLFKKAYEDGCEYFYQCGDDILFLNKGWVSQSIKLLKLYNGYGVTGPLDKMQVRVHTQSFVSRKHYELFKFYYPPEIINWFCDDWITKVYYEDLLFPLLDYWCMNMGGAPRYVSPKENNTLSVQNQVCARWFSRGRKLIQTNLKQRGVTFPKHIMQAEQEKMKDGYNNNEQKYGGKVGAAFMQVLHKVREKDMKNGLV